MKLVLIAVQSSDWAVLWRKTTRAFKKQQMDSPTKMSVASLLNCPEEIRLRIHRYLEKKDIGQLRQCAQNTHDFPSVVHAQAEFDYYVERFFSHGAFEADCARVRELLTSRCQRYIDPSSWNKAAMISSSTRGALTKALIRPILMLLSERSETSEIQELLGQPMSEYLPFTGPEIGRGGDYISITRTRDSQDHNQWTLINLPLEIENYGLLQFKVSYRMILPITEVKLSLPGRVILRHDYSGPFNYQWWDGHGFNMIGPSRINISPHYFTVRIFLDVDGSYVFEDGHYIGRGPPSDRFDARFYLQTYHRSTRLEARVQNLSYSNSWAPGLLDLCDIHSTITQ